MKIIWKIKLLILFPLFLFTARRRWLLKKRQSDHIYRAARYQAIINYELAVSNYGVARVGLVTRRACTARPDEE